MAGGQGTRLGHSGPKGTFMLEVKPKAKSFWFLFYLTSVTILEDSSNSLRLFSHKPIKINHF